MSPSSTPLASSTVNHDTITIELVEPAGMSPAVRITWPPQSTVIRPDRFSDVAAGLVRLFAAASTELAAIKVWKKP